jgi:GNAT superfamily N-acetyltransferase
MSRDDLDIVPATAERWHDLEALFGPERGASSGCWCQWTRIRRPEWTALGRDGRKQRLQAEVESGLAPGLLAYRDGRPVGWCAIAPRPATAKFNASRITGPEGPDAGVWAITCFFIATGERRQGLMARLIEAACRHAFAAGASAVEACPIEPARKLSWGEGFVGIASTFAAAGFVEVARRSPARPLMRREPPA